MSEESMEEFKMLPDWLQTLWGADAGMARKAEKENQQLRADCKTMAKCLIDIDQLLDAGLDIDMTLEPALEIAQKYLDEAKRDEC